MILKGSSSDIAGYHIDAYKTAYSLKKIMAFLKNNRYKILYKEGNKKDWKFIIIAEKIK